MWATIIIAESFKRIMGSTAGNVYSTISSDRHLRFLQYRPRLTLWILVGEPEFATGAGHSPAGAGAV